MKKLLLASVLAIASFPGHARAGVLATGAAYATDELKPDELADKLFEECGEQELQPGPIATCLFEKEEAFGKELEQVYKKALTLTGKNNTLLRESQRSWLKYQESDCGLTKYGRAWKGLCMDAVEKRNVY